MVYYRQKRKGEKKMKINLWRSELTGKIYEAPIDWLPKFSGWQLIATITKGE